MQQSNTKYSPLELQPGDELIGYSFSEASHASNAVSYHQADSKSRSQCPSRDHHQSPPQTQPKAQLAVSYQVSLKCSCCGHKLRVKDEDGSYSGLYQYQKDMHCARCNTPGMQISIRTRLSD